MANNTDGLSDKTIKQNSAEIRDACSNWSEGVSSAALGSIDVTGIFSPLVENGIAVSYIPSLKSALESVDGVATSLISIIGANVDEQEDIDRKTKDKVSGGSSGNYKNYGSGSGGGGGAVASGGAPSSGDYDVKDVDNDLDVKKEFNDYISKLDSYKELDFISGFNSILGTDAYKLLYSEEYSALLKKKILSSPNVDADLKKIISKMDQNEVQTLLRDLLVKNADVSDFSQMIVSKFDSEFKEEFKDSTTSASFENIAKTYTDLTKKANIQGDLTKLYLGDVDKADDYSIAFTRTLVDTLSEQSGVSYEELLSDTRYNDVLKDAVVDIAKTFTTLNISKNVSNGNL